MQKFKSLQEFADHLRMIQTKRVPAMKKLMLQSIGVEVRQIAAEEIIGRLSPLPSIGGFPAWEPLAESTIERKENDGLGKNGDPRSILYATGDMARSIEWKVRGNAVHVGTNDEVATYHELGTSRMPPRPFLGPATIRAMGKLTPKLERLLCDTISGKIPRWRL